MLEYTYRWSIPKGKNVDFVKWINANEDKFNEHRAEGWKYLGTQMVVRGFGDFDAESRWELDDYAALGSGFGDEENQRLFTEFFEEFVDLGQPRQVALLRSSKTVRTLQT